MAPGAVTLVDRAVPRTAEPRRRPSRRRAIAHMAVRRCAFAVPLLAIVSAGLFALASRSPFDPLAGYLGARYVTTSDADRARIAGELGLGDPWWRQYARWLGHVVTGDLGTSRSFGQPVAQVIGERLPWTLLLTGTALTVSVVLALVLGVWTGARSGGVADRIVTPLVTFAQATPPFVVSLVAVAVFAVSLTWLPAGGLTDAGSDPSFGQVARHVVLPAGVLAVSQLPWLLFAVRQSVRGAVESDAVAGAVARGLPRRTVLTRHVVPVASAPFVTVVALRLPELVVGAALVEEVFAWPGIAGALVTSATELDFPLLAALTLGTTAVVLVASLLADIAYVLLDPRVAADA